MDVDLVELLLALPHPLRHTVGQDKPKPVFRRAMAQVVPASVLERTTSGNYVDLLAQVLFEPPVRAAATVFGAPSRLEEAGILDAATARRLRETPAEVPPRFTRASWSLQTTSLVAMEILLRQL
jgi:hypothetical protein